VRPGAGLAVAPPGCGTLRGALTTSASTAIRMSVGGSRSLGLPRAVIPRDRVPHKPGPPRKAGSEGSEPPGSLSLALRVLNAGRYALTPKGERLASGLFTVGREERAS
jgi:hypothetical protein